MLAELAEQRPRFGGRTLRSIYFGGGTPSLWPAQDVGAVIEAVCDAFSAAPTDLEITLEANPEDCEPGALGGWRAAGMTRLSIGTQSTSASDLRTIGRGPDMGHGAPAIAAAAAVGFEHLSADVLLGIPGGDGGVPSALAMAALPVDHLSLYELTLEPGAPLTAAARRGEFVPRDGDELADLYLAAHGALTDAGFEHYEVSSYARPGGRAVHNSLYWSGGEFLGLGNGAASLWRDPGSGRAERWTNVKSVGAYMAAGAGDRVREQLAIEPDEAAQERVWLGLRWAGGVPEASLAGQPELVAWLLGEGLASQRDGHIVPTLRGFLLHDTVASRVVAGWRYT